MKVVNLIWGFTLGAGIDKCYMTYAGLHDVDPTIEVMNVCINVKSRNSHLEPLEAIGVCFIDIDSPTDFSWVTKLKMVIMDYQADVLFTHGFNGAIISLIEKWFCRIHVPIVLTYHGAYHAPTKKKKLVEGIYNGLTHFIYKHIAKKTICVAEYSRQYLLKKGIPNNRLVTVHNGIKDIEVCDNSPVRMNPDMINILTASRIDKVKGLYDMLDAIEILHKRGVKFHYYMVGEGPELNKLKMICKQKGLEQYVSFEGFQSNVPQWLDAADIFALPSLYEYHSIAILEAMRAGKAIVATTVGGNGESIDDMKQGILVPPSNPVAFADGLERIVKDESLRTKISAAARERFLCEFTEDAMKRNLIKVLKS